MQYFFKKNCKSKYTPPQKKEIPTEITIQDDNRIIFFYGFKKIIYLWKNFKIVKMDTTRQNKVSRLVQKEAANFFLHHAAEFPGAMISVTEVRITPDLAEARLFVSIFPADKRKNIIELIEKKNKEIRYTLGKELRHQLRIIPELVFMEDKSLDYAERINELLDKNKDEKTSNEEQ